MAVRVGSSRRRAMAATAAEISTTGISPPTTRCQRNGRFGHSPSPTERYSFTPARKRSGDSGAVLAVSLGRGVVRTTHVPYATHTTANPTRSEADGRRSRRAVTNTHPTSDGMRRRPNPPDCTIAAPNSPTSTAHPTPPPRATRFAAHNQPYTNRAKVSWKLIVKLKA